MCLISWWSHNFSRRKFTAPQFAPNPSHPRKVLTVKEIDFCTSLNGIKHHTGKYELMTRASDPSLVVRRGQYFTMVIRFDRAFDPKMDAVSFIFTISGTDVPNHGRGTQVAIPLWPVEYTVPEERWTAFVEHYKENRCTVKFYSPSDSLVGQWTMTVDTMSTGGSSTYSHHLPFYLLFNPWSEKDDVYFPGEGMCGEYVLQDTGLYWNGTYDNFSRSIWKFSQFEKDILDCSLFLINEIGKVTGIHRGDPVQVAKGIAAAINVQDNSGVLEGLGEFTKGTKPTVWVGSKEILQAYFKTMKPVKYAPCWVYAGVLTSVCRAIGIPCRMVTTFCSAHDSQGSLQIYFFIDDSGKMIEEMNTGSIWSFHVWNEVWMKRQDLDDKYSGWQALDATPQEPFDGLATCGPAPVIAINEGEVRRPYDTGFAYAEINADIVYWKYSGPSKPLKLLGVNTTSHIGQFISTKALGKWEREDITHTYKHSSDLTEAKSSMVKSFNLSEGSYARYDLNEEFDDVQFNLVFKNDTVIGSPFDVVLKAKNVSSNKEYNISGTFVVDSCLYNGRFVEHVKHHKFKQAIRASSTEEITLGVLFEEYFERLVEPYCFSIGCLVKIWGTNYEYFGRDEFHLNKPHINVSISESPVARHTIEVLAVIDNPLPISLKNAYFIVEGHGQEYFKWKFNKPIDPGATAYTAVKYTPQWAGRHTIHAKFYSDQVMGEDGYLEFIVHSIGHL